MSGTAAVRTLTMVCDPLVVENTDDARDLGVALRSVEFA